MGAFNKNRAPLTNPNISPTKRLNFLQTVLSHALWCVGSLNLTTKQLQQLRGIHQGFLRQVIKCKPRPIELPWGFVERWARRVRHWKTYTHHPDLDEMYLRTQYRWAGHIARLPAWRGKNILTDVLRFRDAKWLARCKAQHGNQGHDKRFRVWRWETAISGYFGQDWHDTASDRTLWESYVPDAASWRKHNRFNTPHEC